MQRFNNFFLVFVFLFVIFFANSAFSAPNKVTCSPGTYWNGSSCATCLAQYYCTGFTNKNRPSVNYGLTSCPTGYIDGGTGLTSRYECLLQTTAGYYIASAYSYNQTLCLSGYYCPAALINYGSTGTINACPAGYTSGGTGLFLMSQCSLQTTAGYYISTANSATQTMCTAGYYCPSALIGYGSTGTRIQCTGATYSASGASSCTNCPDGYTANLDVAKTTDSQCQAQTTSGKYIAQPRTGPSNQVDCIAGYYCPAALINYGSTGEIVQCSAGTYSADGSSVCTNCAVGSYSIDAATSCTACQNGTTTSSVGQSRCDADCLNNNDYDTSWVVASWNIGNTVTNLCTINGCAGGYYLAADTCVDVGSNYWSADGSVTRTLCSTGLTTIGFGAGADESADCGRVMNIGGSQLHLRSAKKTSPSLYLQINGSTYYGNMTTSTKGSMRANYNGTNYSIYDDSM